jgi:hypothetical protein
MIVYAEIFWSSQEIIFICKQESAREGELKVKTDLWHPDNNSDPSLETESAQMRYFFEEWLEMPALSPVKRKVWG